MKGVRRRRIDSSDNEDEAVVQNKDALDEYIDVNRHRIVKDEDTGREIILTDHELNLLEKIQSGRYAAPITDPYEDWSDWFKYADSAHPLSAAPEPKRRFIPSKWEAQKVLKIVKAIRRGAIVPKKEQEQKEDQEADQKPFYLLWETETQHDLPNFMHLAAPKVKLPGHEESYNPPIEYIPTKEEREEWEKTDPELRLTDFLPQKFSALRHVGAYERSLHERFERCLDLYLCPRARKKRMRVDPESLLPQLPSPADLQPFPQSCIMEFKGHDSAVRTVSFDSSGQLLASGDESGIVRIWEIDTGRCLLQHTMSDPITCVSWRPHTVENEDVPILAVCSGDEVCLINAATSTHVAKIVNSILLSGTESKSDDGDSIVKWSVNREGIVRVTLKHSARVNSVSWHAKGDYLVSVSKHAQSKSVLVHRISQHSTQNPFSRHRGQVQAAVFHPIQPIIIVATRQHVRLYHLVRHIMIRRLVPGLSSISTLDIHHGGDHLIVGSMDKRVVWFDLDYSSKPFRVLRYHTYGVRQVVYHKKYPLFASASDDGTTHVFHGRVYNDLTQNPMIVPLKVLKGHTAVRDYGVMGCEFHPNQSWIATCGADSRVLLWG